MKVTLGRISNNDPDAKKAIKDHLDPRNEPDEYVRFWALEGLVAGKASDLEELATKIIEQEGKNQVQMLALAILASKNDEKSQKEIEKSVSTWETVRALRIVLIMPAVKGLCELIDKREFSSIVSEAIIALSQIPPNQSQYAQKAAQTLENFVIKCRPSAYWDAMRTQALSTLGSLKVESTAPLLIEELDDDNPAIVREAAQALEKVVGIKIATARIVEAASRAGKEYMERFASALRWMDRDAIVEELEAVMVSGPLDQQDIARTLLSEIGGSAAYQKLKARTKAMDQYTSVMKDSEVKIQRLFDSSIKDAHDGFKLATIMDTVVFFLGIALIAISAGLVLSKGGTLDNWAGIGLTGGGGVLGVIYGIMIAKPRKQVRESVDHLMQLKLIFLAYLRQLNQADQAYTRRLLEDEPLTLQEVHEFSKMVGTTMSVAVEQIINNQPTKAITDV